LGTKKLVDWNDCKEKKELLTIGFSMPHGKNQKHLFA